MPVYEYECAKCGGVTEALRPSRDADQPLACEKCGSPKTKRVHSVFSAGVGESHPEGCAAAGGGFPGPCGGCCGEGACGMGE